MTVTDQLKIIDNKIKANQAQYDLDRLSARISSYSSGDLRKHEYLTGENLGFKPSVFERAKFDYSTLGNIFTKGLDKDDQKEGPFKRLEYIKDKNVELLNAFSAANKVRKAAKNESDFLNEFKYVFYKFYRDFKKFKRMSLGSAYDEMNDFYALLNPFINTHKATTTETKNRKNRSMNNVNQLYNKYFDTYKKIYESEKVKDEEKRGRDYKQFEIIDNGDQESKSTKKEETETKKPDEIQKPLWVKLNKNDFDSLIQDVLNNLNNDEFKTSVDKKAYDLKNAKKGFDQNNYAKN